MCLNRGIVSSPNGFCYKTLFTSVKLTYNTFVLMTVKNVSDDVWLSSGYGLPSVQLKFIKLFVF